MNRLLPVTSRHDLADPPCLAIPSYSFIIHHSPDTRRVKWRFSWHAAMVKLTVAQLIQKPSERYVLEGNTLWYRSSGGGRNLRTFRINLLLSSFTRLIMGEAGLFKTSIISFFRKTLRHIPDDRRKNFISRKNYPDRFEPKSSFFLQKPVTWF
jgi:hypothetical protein